ncbi:MAG: tetratricopeptide repeat protein [Bacillota bacterium]
MSSLDTKDAGPASWVHQGQFLAGKGDHAAAIDLYDRAIATDPHYAEAYAWKASSLLAIGDIDAAETGITEALKLNNQDAHFHVIAGRVWVARGQVEKARESYDQAAKLAPKKAGTFYADLASALAARNDPKLNAPIESALKAAAASDPPNLDALFTLGQSYAIAGKQEGRTYLQQYLDASNKLPEDQRDLQKTRLAKQMIRAMDIVRGEG